jgi:phosphopantetheine adenylyltransferase
MTEREQLLSQMVSHKILMTDRLKAGIPLRDGSWFDKHGRGFNPVENIYSLRIKSGWHDDMPDLEATRAISAHYLGLAHYPPTFFRENRFDNPPPTENDRLLYCDYIEFQLSITGLLNVQEIQQIRQRGWWDHEIESMPIELIFQKKVDLPDFQEVCDKIASWKEEGWKVAFFHGAFDPVTITHLQNATTAYLYGLVTGVPLKLVIGFDSDELIKRKGKNHPRYPLDKRREEFGRFWMADETVVLRAQKPITEEFVKDYLDLGVDYIVTTTNPDDIATRIDAIIESNLELIPISESPLATATQIIRKARSRK